MGWSLWHGKPKITQNMPQQSTMPMQAVVPTIDQIDAILSGVKCPDCEMSAAKCAHDTVNYIRTQAQALLAAGLPPASAVDHLFMMGFEPLKNPESALPDGHPPIQQTLPDGHPPIDK